MMNTEVGALIIYNIKEMRACGESFGRCAHYRLAGKTNRLRAMPISPCAQGRDWEPKALLLE